MYACYMIHGTNDAAVIGDPNVADVTEDSGVNGSGNLTATRSEERRVGKENRAPFQTTETKAEGNLGSLSLAANGSYTYTVANSAVQYLGVIATKVHQSTTYCH